MGNIIGFGSTPVVVSWAASFIAIMVWAAVELFRRRLVTLPTFVILWAFWLPIVLQYPFTFSPANAVLTGASEKMNLF